MSEAEQIEIVCRWIRSVKKRGPEHRRLAEELEGLLGWGDDE